MGVKCTRRSFLDFALVGFAVSAAVMLAYSTCVGGMLAWYGWQSEAVVYVLSGGCLLRLFYHRNHSPKSKLNHAVSILLTTIMFTVLVCLYNNLLHFLNYNFAQPGFSLLFGEIVPYHIFLKEDLAYSIGWGKFRYLAVATAMLFACLMDMALFSKRGRRLAAQLKHKVQEFFPEPADDGILPIGFVIIEEPNLLHRKGIEHLLSETGQHITWDVLEPLMNTADRVMYIALLRGTPIGVIVATVNNDECATRTGEIVLLAVTNDTPMYSVRQELIAQVSGHLIGKGCMSVSFDIDALKSSEVEILQGLGFHLEKATFLKLLAQRVDRERHPEECQEKTVQ